MRMVEYLVLRLKEVKGLNLSIATRQSITDVVELQKNRWEPSRMGTAKEANEVFIYENEYCLQFRKCCAIFGYLVYVFMF